MSNPTPKCGGQDRGTVCSLCGRPPGEPCPAVPTEKCPTCKGTGRVK